MSENSIHKTSRIPHFLGIFLILSSALLFFVLKPSSLSSSSPISPQSKSAFEQGLACLESQQLERAREFFLKAIEHSPRWEDAHFFHGRTLAKQKKFTEALLSYEQAYQLAPQKVAIVLELVQLCQFLKKTDTALEYLQKLKTMTPLPPEVPFYEAELLFQKGHFKEALPLLLSQKETQRNGQIYYKIARCYQNLKQYDEEFQIYSEALQRYPQESSLFRAYLGLAQKLKKEEQVLEELRKASAQDPQQLYWKLYIAQTLLQKKETLAEGKTLLEELTQQDSFRLESLLILARKCFAQGALESAQQYLERGLQKRPSTSYTLASFCRNSPLPKKI
jgi:tetratricopeptide (TPR) repeat protein